MNTQLRSFTMIPPPKSTPSRIHYNQFEFKPPKITRHVPRILAPLSSLPTNKDGYVDAGPPDQPPDYTSIDNTPLNKIIYSLFRRRMIDALGTDSSSDGYPAIIDLTRKLNSLGSPRQTQVTTRKILNSLFPSWLPPAFKIMFANPFPEFSCQLNAWATWLTCQWLMGPCEINDVPIDNDKIGKGHGVLITRCRYLEEAGCASICINSCKIPTQEFFEKDMGLALTMTPNYENFECQFSFGATPPPKEGDEAFSTPCFSRCPSLAKKKVVKNALINDEKCFRIDITDSSSSSL